MPESTLYAVDAIVGPVAAIPTVVEILKLCVQIVKRRPRILPDEHGRAGVSPLVESIREVERTAGISPVVIIDIAPLTEVVGLFLR